MKGGGGKAQLNEDKLPRKTAPEKRSSRKKKRTEILEEEGATDGSSSGVKGD